MISGLRKPIALGLLAVAAGLAGCSDNSLPSMFTDCADCPTMIEIPGGAFSMGFDGGEDGRPEGPVRQVSVPAFAMGVYEVT